ncbi:MULTISPECIES: TniQ family protein [unclassified Streptomyces]|uniref:TniQ family protein n=1 Tax=unclassified Streptomyces TaxID=2593676 RepID=UPI002F908A30
MTSPFGSFDPLARLPVRVRLQPGESTDSYIRRLARANYLKPSYLHGVLTASPNWFGKPRLERLSVLTGHSPEVLERVLADARPSLPPRRRGTARKSKGTDKPALYRRIRRDAEADSLSADTHQHMLPGPANMRCVAAREQRRQP